MKSDEDAWAEAEAEGMGHKREYRDDDGNTRDFRATREVGKKRNEAGVFGMPQGDQRLAVKLGTELLGNELGRNLFGNVEELLFKVAAEVELQAVIWGCADTYQSDPRRTKRIWKSSCASMKGWNAFMEGVEAAFRYGHKQLVKGQGGQLEWLHASNPEKTMRGETKAAAAYARMYYLVKCINEFVQAHFDRGIEGDVLQYIGATIWMDLREAEKECAFSSAAIIYRQLMLLDIFVNKLGCIVQEAFFRYNLYGRNVSKQTDVRRIGTDDGGGGTGGGSGGSNRGGGYAGSGTPRGAGEGYSSPTHRTSAPDYGVAPALRAWRSDETDLHGNPYMNARGEVYGGSVCDGCEKLREDRGDNTSFHHHPLRCNRAFPQWRTSPPEEDAGVQIYVRGGLTKTWAEVSK